MRAFDNISLSELDRLLGGREPAVVVVHAHPDGDALGSGMAMVHYLRNMRGRQALLLIPDAYPDYLSFCVDADLVIDAFDRRSEALSALSKCGLVICQDFNEFSRTGVLSEALHGVKAPKVLIDHHLHPSEEDFDLVFSDTEVSSASELLYSLLKEMPDVKAAARLPLDVATPLMVGMTTDTNNFANSVFPSTLAMASDLLAAGVDRDGILSHLYNQYRPNRLRAMGFCLSELLKITPDGVAYIVLRESDRSRLDLREGETEGFVNLPLGVAEVRMSLFLREDNGHFRVSIRSKKGTSANRMASTFFHGGGHELASGGKLYFPEDIPDASHAEEYIETVSARFMRNDVPVENK